MREIVRQLVIGLLSFTTALAADPAEQLAQMRATILGMISTNNHTAIYDQYRTYAAEVVANNAKRGRRWDGQELFRLPLIERWLGDPLCAPGEGEALTRSLHRNAANPARMAAALAECAGFLDLPPPTEGVSTKVHTPEEALADLEKRLAVSRGLVGEALKGIGAKDLVRLWKISEEVLIPNTNDATAHSLTDEQANNGRFMLNALSEVDLKAMNQAAATLCAVLEKADFLDLLTKLPPQRKGTILVGGPGDDTYNLEELKDVECIIDPAGNDTYLESPNPAARPVFLILDFKGNDRHVARKSFAQGCGFLGIGILVDREGDDRYEANSLAQGCGVGGIGLLVDGGGNDVYTGDIRVQGTAMRGIGMLIDRAGNDAYAATLFAQGYGGAGGVGMLDDLAGNDRYQAGGKYDDSYQEPPRFHKEAWSQGCGSGLRGFGKGGFGILLDGGGDDLYEADYFSGGGYWYGAGMARDFGGNDVRRPLSKDFSRYGLAYGCHSGIGLIYDDTGDDRYYGGIGVLGFGWDIALGGLFDFGGNDLYSVTASGEGLGCEMAWGILFDGNGSDKYMGVATNASNGQGFAGKVTYHPQFNGAGNFSFLVDAGEGQDKFSCGAPLNAATRRCADGGVGYLIHHVAVPGQVDTAPWSVARPEK